MSSPITKFLIQGDVAGKGASNRLLKENLRQKNIFADSGCSWIKEESLTRHQKTRSHQKAAKGKSINQTDLLSSFSIQFGEDKVKIICQMRSAHFLAKHHLALEKYSELCHLVDYSHANYNCIILDSQP
ncbi:10359_t:CDS:2 [Ambispora leptoticha]|uniref:10359_t:CDS:1 n=1 Tax=Ambispora leptoticha TaxID=144679 RepID=A0A9N8ZFG2_9GLOM|nr:10359_t:CDS:2 [Ambispora leptoticha]